eukprot:479819_1
MRSKNKWESQKISKKWQRDKNKSDKQDKYKKGSNKNKKLSIIDCPAKGMEFTINFIQRKFQNVCHVSTNQLKQDIENNTDIIILDVRDAVEYHTSHILNAINVPPNTSIKNVIIQNESKHHIGSKHHISDTDKEESDLKKDNISKIYCYCSVGYRSSTMVRKLQNHGIKNIYNVEGSIFKWINEGNKLVDKDGKPTPKVHAHSKIWSLLLHDANQAVYSLF